MPWYGGTYEARFDGAVNEKKGTLVYKNGRFVIYLRFRRKDPKIGHKVFKYAPTDILGGKILFTLNGLYALA